MRVVVLVPRRAGIADRDRLWVGCPRKGTGRRLQRPRPRLESCVRGPNMDKPTCMHEGCGSAAQVRGLCRRHWKVWDRRGWEMLPAVDRKQLPFPRWDSKVERTPTCWIWQGAIDGGGYGNFWSGTGYVSAHRWGYEHLVGAVPDGLDLDHLCHTRDLACPGGVTCAHRRCVNPAHLEPVTRQENLRRGRGTKCA